MNRFLKSMFAVGIGFVAYGLFLFLRPSRLQANFAPAPVVSPAAPFPGPSLETAKPLPVSAIVDPIPIPKKPARKISPKRAPSKAASIPPASKSPPAKLPPAVPPPPSSLTDQFNPEVLKSLPKPVAPPTDVALPQVIAESGQWIGNQSGMTQPAHVVFRNPESWGPFWSKAIAPYTRALSETPEIDFSKEMIVGVFLGEKPLPGYQIHIRSAAFEGQGEERRYVVRYENSDRFLGIFATPFAVQPFHLLKAPSFTGKIDFIEVKNK